MTEWFCEKCQIPMTDLLREVNPTHSCSPRSKKVGGSKGTDINHSYDHGGCNTCKGKELGFLKEVSRAVPTDRKWDETDSENMESVLKEKYGEGFVDAGIESVNPGGSSRGPSFWNMVGNFSKAMHNWSKKGFDVASKEEHKRRLDICKSCPLYENLRCKHADCGCFVNAKAWVSTESCPIGKWEK